jgi:hypothetical protein
MKYKLTVFTHQDSLEQIAPRLRGIYIDGIRDFPGTKNPYVEAVKALEALPRPLDPKAVQRIIKAACFPADWHKGYDWRPVCGLCEEPVDWLLVIEDVFQCEDEYGDPTFDFEICPKCVAELGTEVLKYELP